MYFNFRSKFVEELPKQNTQVWSCIQAGCKGWMRDNFAFDTKPVCCLCLSPMVSDMRMLPSLVNSNDELKAIKKGMTAKTQMKPVG